MFLCCNCGNRSTDKSDATCAICRFQMVPAPAPASSIREPGDILRLWQQGHPLSAQQKAIVGDMMAANSIAMAAQTWRAV